MSLITRRGIFKLLLPAAAATTVVTAVAVAQEPAADPNRLMYKGYELWWTGWKGSPSNFVLVGQWIGTIKDPYYDRLYVSTPGDNGHFSDGQEFSLYRHDDQPVITPQSTDAEMLAEKNNALNRMKSLVDHIVAQGGTSFIFQIGSGQKSFLYWSKESRDV